MTYDMTLEKVETWVFIDLEINYVTLNWQEQDAKEWEGRYIVTSHHAGNIFSVWSTFEEALTDLLSRVRHLK